MLTPRRAGYNQGVYGTVSATPGFIAMAEIGHDDVVTDSTKQGGLAAAYYFGAMWACFVGGKLRMLSPSDRASTSATVWSLSVRP